jgi:hypothetical protein
MILLVMGCAGQLKLRDGEEKLTDAYGPAEYKTSSSEGSFIGVSKHYRDEASARNDAALDARKQIIQSLQMNISTEILDQYLIKGESGEILTGETFQDAKTKAVAENILSVKPEGYYVEKWAKGVSTGLEYYYTAWTKINYSREEHNKLVSSVIDAMMNLAEPALIDGMQFRRQGKIRDAIRQFRRVKDLTSEINGYNGVSPQLLSKVKSLQIRTDELLSGISILVAVDESIEGKCQSSRVVETRLAEKLSSLSGFAVKSSLDWSNVKPDDLLEKRDMQTAIAEKESVDLLLIGKASVNRVTKQSENIFIARSEMKFKLVEGATGNVLWETTIPNSTIKDSRGFGNNATTAAERALSLSDQERDNPFDKLAINIIEALK